ncbi:hypothetical protein SSX86_030511 [Deinandra increscens subsp. villosa]|uniref:Uncharacterized protein n=1 Tax=Deinandra increscens subsp. villosa TaxID=3103831 RepID=A0AAP0GK16_9ASTR
MATIAANNLRLCRLSPFFKMPPIEVSRSGRDASSVLIVRSDLEKRVVVKDRDQMLEVLGLLVRSRAVRDRLSCECLLYFRPADVQRQERGYYRYLAEFKFGNDKKDVAPLSMETYEPFSLLLPALNTLEALGLEIQQCLLSV